MRFDPLLSPNKSPASLPIPSFPPPFACPPFYPALTLLPYVLPSLRPSVHLHPPSPSPLHPKYLIAFLLPSFYAPTTGSNTHTHARTHTYTREAYTRCTCRCSASLRRGTQAAFSSSTSARCSAPPPSSTQSKKKTTHSRNLEPMQAAAARLSDVVCGVRVCFCLCLSQSLVGESLPGPLFFFSPFF